MIPFHIKLFFTRTFWWYMMLGWVAIGGVGCASTGTQSPSLPQQQSELARQQIEVERQRLELERQRTELERQKREELEQKMLAEEQARKAAEAAITYAQSEYEAFRNQIESASADLGKFLLRRTHPTGTYGSTDSPLVSRSADGHSITTTLTVNWKGGFLEVPYETTYRFDVSKEDGFGSLSVERDSSIIKIDPEFLRSAESQLREAFNSDN